MRWRFPSNVLPISRHAKDPTGTKRLPSSFFENTKGVGDKKENLLFTEGKDSSFNTSVLKKTSTEDVFRFITLYFVSVVDWSEDAQSNN